MQQILIKDILKLKRFWRKNKVDLNKLNIQEAIKGLKEKEFTAVELTNSVFKRIENVDNKINAFITLNKEEAIKEAQEADKKYQAGNIDEKPLLGIPIAVKDNYCTRNLKTTASSDVLENFIPPYESTVTKKLKESGAIIIGKGNCDAWAHGSSGENSDFFVTRNPYDLERTPGGSSSGPAAAVASSMVLASMGTDTGGSIRLPASFCNLVGLKPTYGRVSRYGVVSMASSLDTMGHFTKDVESNALILSVTAGKDEKDSTSSLNPVTDYLLNIRQNIKGIRIGIPKEYFVSGLDPKVNEVIKTAIKKYEDLGAIIQEISLPHTEQALAVYYIVQPAEVSSNLARYDGIRYGNSRNNFGDEAKRRIMLGTYTLSAGYYDQYYLKAMKVRTLLINDFKEAFKNVDILLTPTSPTLPFRLGEKIDDPLNMYLSDIYTVTMNLVGVPSISIPAGFVNNLPVGLQLTADFFKEDLLYKIAFAFEQQTKCYLKEPNL